MISEIKLFIGLQVQQLKDGIYINQSKYVREILKTFGLEDSKLVGTPMVTSYKLSKEDDYKEVDETLYRYMIGKLQYMVHSIPDIAQAVGLVVIFLYNPKESQLIAVKRIFKYLKRTKNYGLWYGHKGDLNLSM